MSHLKSTATTEQLYRALEQEMAAMEQSLGYRRRRLAHRHYLEHDASHGTPSQRQREAAQSHLHRAVDSIYDRQFQTALQQSSGVAETESNVSLVVDRRHKRVLRKSSAPLQRIANERIMEEMNTGGFKSIRGKGAPLKNEPATHILENLDEKLNKVLINSGCAPDWIALDKEIRESVAKLKLDVTVSWVKYSNSSSLAWMSAEEQWAEDREKFKERMDNINDKIRKLNFDVPSLHMQRVPLKYDRFMERVTKETTHESSHHDGSSMAGSERGQTSQDSAAHNLSSNLSLRESSLSLKQSLTESPVLSWVHSLIQRFIIGRQN